MIDVLCEIKKQTKDEILKKEIEDFFTKTQILQCVHILHSGNESSMECIPITIIISKILSYMT